MRGVARHPTINAIASLLVVVFLVTLGIFVGAPPSSRSEAIAIGVASSLLATLVFALLDVVLTGSRRMELSAQLDRAADLSSNLTLVRDADRYGVAAVKPKKEYSEEEWLAIPRGAEQSMTMVGHALDKWCEGKIESVFCEAIRRVIQNGGVVRLLMLAEDAGRVPGLRDTGYTKRIQRTLDVLTDLDGTLTGPGELRVFHLGDALDMPYMAVANDKEMITAAYPAAAHSSDRMPALRLSTESTIAKRLRADIDSLLECGVTPARLRPPRA